MVVEWELCKTTSAGFNGLIPLQLKYDKAGPPMAANAASQARSELTAAVNGFNAGDFRERPPRRP